MYRNDKGIVNILFFLCFFCVVYPQRVTYYTRMDGVEGQSNKANYGALFSLLSRGVQGLNVSSVIGVYLGDRISHGANFGSAVDEKTYLKRSVTLWNYPVLST